MNPQQQSTGAPQPEMAWRDTITDAKSVINTEVPRHGHPFRDKIRRIAGQRNKALGKGRQGNIAERGEDGWHHLSPFIICLSPTRYLRELSLGGLLGITSLGFIISWWVSAALILIGLVVTLIFSWIRWSYFQFRISSDSLAIRSGIWARHYRTLPFDRIHDVNIEQNLVARLLSLAKVTFDTGATAGELDKKDSGLDSISLPEAEHLRDLIRRYREDLVANKQKPWEQKEGGAISKQEDVATLAIETQIETQAALPSPGTLDSSDTPDNSQAQRAVGLGQAAFETESAQNPPSIARSPNEHSNEHSLFTMTPKQLVQAGLFNFAYAAPAIMLGALASIALQLPHDWIYIPVWNEAVLYLNEGNPRLLLQTPRYWLLLIGGGIGALAIYVASGFVIGIGQMLYVNWNFCLSRSPRAYRRIRGLTTRSDVAIPLRRVQAAIIASGWLRQHFGWYQLWLQSLASDSNRRPNHEILPLGRLSHVDDLLAGIGLRRAPEDAQRQPCHIMIVIPELIPASVLLAVALSAAVEGRWGFGTMGALGAIFWMAIALKSASRHSWTLHDNILTLRRGWLYPREVILPCAAVQTADIVRGPLLQYFAQAKLVFGIPGTSGFGAHNIPAIPAHQAEDIRQAILTQGLRKRKQQK